MTAHTLSLSLKSKFTLGIWYAGEFNASDRFVVAVVHIRRVVATCPRAFRRNVCSEDRGKIRQRQRKEKQRRNEDGVCLWRKAEEREDKDEMNTECVHVRSGGKSLRKRYKTHDVEEMRREGFLRKAEKGGLILSEEEVREKICRR